MRRARILHLLVLAAVFTTAVLLVIQITVTPTLIYWSSEGSNSTVTVYANQYVYTFNASYPGQIRVYLSSGSLSGYHGGGLYYFAVVTTQAVTGTTVVVCPANPPTGAPKCFGLSESGGNYLIHACDGTNVYIWPATKYGSGPVYLYFPDLSKSYFAVPWSQFYGTGTCGATAAYVITGVSYDGAQNRYAFSSNQVDFNTGSSTATTATWYIPLTSVTLGTTPITFNNLALEFKNSNYWQWQQIYLLRVTVPSGTYTINIGLGK